MQDENTNPAEPDAPQKSWADRNPKASILLIAGVFYLILFGMCGFVFVLLIRA